MSGTFAVPAALRNFTRYGYGDFYQHGSNVDLLYRVWPGTQKHLLWGDPALASGYGRAANFCGAAGLELCEPLFFKGREGSGHPGGRDAYADASLGAADLDTTKFAVTYMTWGRYLYNPGHRARLLSSLSRAGLRTRRPRTGNRSRRLQPHPSARHHRVVPVRLQPRILAGDADARLHPALHRPPALH